MNKLATCSTDEIGSVEQVANLFRFERKCPMRCTIVLGLALALPGLVVAGDLEETLRFYLSKSDVVVLGEFASEPIQ